MMLYTECPCGYSLFRIDSDDHKLSCVNCGQIAFEFVTEEA